MTNDESNSNVQKSDGQGLRILIIKPSALGDIATTLPLLCDLHAAWPDAKIDWLIHSAYTSLIEGHDALHQAVTFERKKLAAWWYKPSAFKAFMALIKTLRKNRYDIVIDAQGLFRSGFLTRITSARTRVGFAHARELASFAYTHKARLPNRGKAMLAVDRMRALAIPLNVPPLPTADFRLPIFQASDAAASELLQRSAFSVQRSFIALIPGARWNTKRWPIDRYAKLTHHLLDAGHALLLLGSPDEKPLCDQILSQLETRNSKRETILNLAGQTDLATMVALLARARLVIGNDSGPIHVAAALGTPIIALYGPTSPDFVGPYAQLDQVLRHPVPCHPCRRKECDHHSCMNGLNVELVWEKTRITIDAQHSETHVPKIEV